jgi:hypothetical protein
LADAEVRYLVVHQEELSNGALAALKAYLPTPPLHADDRLLIYSTQIVEEP